MTKIARKWTLLYRAVGPRLFLVRAVRRTLASVYRRRIELVIVKRLDAAMIGGHDGGQLDLRPITPDDAQLLTRFNERYRSSRKVVAILRYLANGYRGFAAFVDGEPIGYWWWVDNRVASVLTHPSVQRFDLRLADDEVFAFDYFIAPEHRGRGAAVRFLSLIYRELAQQGYRAVWGSVDADNAAARWVYAMQGNRVTKRSTGREVLSSVLFQDSRVFIRNTKRHPDKPFDYRLLLSLKAGDLGHGAGAVASTLSSDGV